MNIHFNHTEPVQAPAEVLFDVITDYTSYPSFNPALIKVEVVTKDGNGAEFLADRKTKIGKQVRAFDRYERNGDLVVERTYDGNQSARSTWTVHPVDDSHCALTIDAAQSMGPVRGLAMKPALKHLFYSINFTPFIDEAERRAALRDRRGRQVPRIGIGIPRPRPATPYPGDHGASAGGTDLTRDQPARPARRLASSTRMIWPPARHITQVNDLREAARLIRLTDAAGPVLLRAFRHGY